MSWKAKETDAQWVGHLKPSAESFLRLNEDCVWNRVMDDNIKAQRLHGGSSPCSKQTRIVSPASERFHSTIF